MHSLVYYAILGSLIAAAAGTLILITVAVTHSLKRFDTSHGDPTPKQRARQARVVRLADSCALLCFAVSAGLAFVAVMQQARATSLAVAPRDGGEIMQGLRALESRVAQVERQQQAGGVVATEASTGEDRIAQLERRIDAVEARATPAASRVPKARAARTATPASLHAERTIAAQPHPETVAPMNITSPTPAPPAGVATPEAVATPNREHVIVTPSREPVAGSAVVAPPIGRSGSAGVAPPSAKGDVRDQEISVADQLRRDWAELKRDAAEGQWRETWNGLKRLFRH